MSDSLKDRLASHSGAFEGLLSLIPAKYYYEDDAKAQLKGADAKNRAKTSDAKNVRESDPDTDAGTSALDELKRREGTAANNEKAGDDDEDVPIYDDYGNQIGGPKELSIQELLKAKARGESVPPEPKTAETEAVPKPTAESAKKAGAGKQHAGKKANADPNSGKIATAEKHSNGSAHLSNGTAHPEEAKHSEGVNEPDTAPAENANGEQGAKVAVQSKKGIAELRAKLAARISEMRSKRKAPGSDAPGAPKNREELLALRKHRQELKQKSQSLKRKRDGDDASDDDEPGDDELGDAGSGIKGQKLMFGQVQFSDGGRLGRDLDRIEEKKRVKKRNAIDQLRVIENRKAKIEGLAGDKKEQVSENAKWSRAILQSEGAKIRDDEKLLRKTLRAKERQKSKSAKAWRDRKETVTKDIAAREAKRTANIKAHREAKQLRLKGKKRKEHMKRAGFEGKRR